jgi:hypothetical protein
MSLLESQKSSGKRMTKRAPLAAYPIVTAQQPRGKWPVLAVDDAMGEGYLGQTPKSSSLIRHLLQTQKKTLTSPRKDFRMAGKFEPKVPVQLNPPKDDPISLADLAKADGECPSKLSSAET